MLEFQVQSINRAFGAITLPNGDSVQRLVAAAGWCRVKENVREGEASPLHEELQSLSAAAQSAKLGVFQDADGNAEAFVSVNRNADNAALLSAHRGDRVRGLVEYVRDGAAFRVVLLDTMSSVSLFLSGVACPRVSPRGPDGTPQAPEPFSREARHFVEVRLLNREVDVVLDGADRYGNLVGTLEHPAGNIGQILLQNGFARIAEWSMSFVAPTKAAVLRRAEQAAKQQRLRLWRSWQPPTVSGDKTYQAVVTEVHSGDSISVLKGDGAAEVRLFLSSVRAPRMGNRHSGAKDEPFAAEAKEALRSKLIGKAVKVVVDYEREMPAREGEASGARRLFVSVIHGKQGKEKNVALQLVQEGLLSIVRAGKDRADDKSAIFDDLAIAEEVAKTAKVGLHGAAARPKKGLSCADLTGDGRRAKAMESEFLRERSGLRARVEHVFNGAMVKVSVPKLGAMIMLRIGCLRCPRPSTSQGRSAEPFGEEAKALARRWLMQRDVDVVVSQMDRNGVGIGEIRLGDASRRPGGAEGSFEEAILGRGLARLDERWCENLGPSLLRPLEAAQEAARAADRGIWLEENAKAAAAAKKAAEEALEGAGEAAGPSDALPEGVCGARVADISDAGRFFLHLGDGEALREVNEMMEAFGEEHGLRPGPPMAVRRGTKCAALFNDGDGDKWYRAVVSQVGAGGSEARVTYVDFGNASTVAANRLAPLDSSYFALPFAAIGARLALLRCPALDADFGRDAAVFLSELTWGRDLDCRFHGARDGLQEVSLWHKVTEAGEAKGEGAAQAALSVAEEMVKNGLATLRKTAEAEAKEMGIPEAFEALGDLQEEARKGRVALWRYGDLADDDEDM